MRTPRPAFGRVLERQRRTTEHDLSASQCRPPTLPALLDMANEADRRRWETPSFGYADPRGSVWLRDAIALRHAGLQAADVLCCAGAHEAMACAMQALLKPDDHAIVVLPVYPPIEWAVTSRCAATGIALEDRSWRLDLDRVAAAIRPNTRLLLTNFPNSPTGAEIDAVTLEALVRLCRRHGLWLVNDEVYGLTGREPGGSFRIADLYEQGVSVDSVSKGLGLPGLRIGWLACRDACLMEKALQAKAMLSGGIAVQGETLAHIALGAQARIIGFNRAAALTSLARLRQVLEAHPELFEMQEQDNLAFACPRYLGIGSADAFAGWLAKVGILVLPASLWGSSLGPVPTDRLRVGFGAQGVEQAIERLAVVLDRQPGRDTHPGSAQWSAASSFA